MKNVRFWFHMFRFHGNGRLRSITKALRVLNGQRVFAYPPAMRRDKKRKDRQRTIAAP